jgi:hypothetical protein
MPEVICDRVGRGMRDDERTVAVKDVFGHPEYIRVPHDFLTYVGETAYLPVGVVHFDKEKDVVLIEFPHEPDTGRNRIWVRSRDLIYFNGQQP